MYKTVQHSNQSHAYLLDCCSQSRWVCMIFGHQSRGSYRHVQICHPSSRSWAGKHGALLLDAQINLHLDKVIVKGNLPTQCWMVSMSNWSKAQSAWHEIGYNHLHRASDLNHWIGLCHRRRFSIDYNILIMPILDVNSLLSTSSFSCWGCCATLSNIISTLSQLYIYILWKADSQTVIVDLPGVKSHCMYIGPFSGRCSEIRLWMCFSRIC